MIKTIYSIFDRKANAFLTPFYMQHEAMAIRALMAAIKDEKTEIHMFPEDYSLFDLGTFDDVAGIIDSSKGPREVSPATSIKQMLFDLEAKR